MDALKAVKNYTEIEHVEYIREWLHKAGMIRLVSI